MQQRKRPALSRCLLGIGVLALLTLLNGQLTPANAQEILYDIPAIGGNVFPGSNGRLIVDDADLPETPENDFISRITLPVVASGMGSTDITGFLFEDAGGTPGEVIWSRTLNNIPFNSEPGAGDFRSVTWNNVFTPLPDSFYWGVQFTDIRDLDVVALRQGDVSAGTPFGLSSDPTLLLESISGSPSGPFTEINFISNGLDVEDNLAITIQTVPEPQVIGLLLFGIGALFLMRRKRMRSQASQDE